MNSFEYCSYFFKRRRLKRKDGKIWLVCFMTKHIPFGLLNIDNNEIKELLIRGLYKGESIKKEWEKKDRIIYYSNGGYIDKIIWGEYMYGYYKNGVEIEGSLNLVNEEVKGVIEDKLGEKIEEVEFLPVILKGTYWEKEIKGNDIWGEAEAKKGGEIKGYYLLNVRNKIYQREDIIPKIRELGKDTKKIEEYVKNLYKGKMFVEYIMGNLKYNSIDSRVWIRKDILEEIEKKVKPEIYKKECKDMIKKELDSIVPT